MPRKKGQDAFSLFAFQDIITSVTGIILLIALILALELVQREKITGTPGQQPLAEESMTHTPSQIAQLRRRLAEGEEILAELAVTPAWRLREDKNRLEDDLNELRVELATPQPVERPSPSATPQELAETQKEIERLEKELKSLKSTKKVVYNKDPTVSKTGWVFDIGPNSLTVSRIGDNATDRRDATTFRQLSKAIAWAKRRDKNDEYFVLAVRPKSIPVYYTLRDALEGLGFDLGFDLIADDIEVVGRRE